MKPIAIICCWKCHRTNVTLRKVGKDDYVCKDHEIYGKPEIGNQSKIYLNKKNDK